MEEKTKKTLLNQKIGEEELEKYSSIIVKKALKVLSCSGSNAELVEKEKKTTKKTTKKSTNKGLNIYALMLLEKKDLDTLEDLKQEVAIQIILDNYTITKNAYHIVRKYIYNNYEKTPLEIFTENGIEEKNDVIEKTIDNTCYLSYMNNNNDKELKKAKKIDLKKLYNMLSETEQKVFQYYIINNIKQVQVANILDIKRNAVNVYKTRILKKAEKCLVNEI